MIKANTLPAADLSLIGAVVNSYVTSLENLKAVNPDDVKFRQPLFLGDVFAQLIPFPLIVLSFDDQINWKQWGRSQQDAQTRVLMRFWFPDGYLTGENPGMNLVMVLSDRKGGHAGWYNPAGMPVEYLREKAAKLGSLITMPYLSDLGQPVEFLNLYGAQVPAQSVYNEIAERMAQGTEAVATFVTRSKGERK